MKKILNLHYVLFSVLILSIGLISSCGDDDDDGLSTLAGLTGFSIQGQSEIFTINQDALTITNGSDSLPFGTDVSALVAVFDAVPLSTVTVGGTTQESGVTANNFGSPVTYTVTAQDGITVRNYTVTVNVAQLDPETVAWNRVIAEAQWGPFGFTNGAYFDGKLWMFGYTNSSFGAPTVATFNSTDGVNWTAVDARDDEYNHPEEEEGYPVPGTRRPAIVSHNGSLYLIAGYLNGRADADGNTPFNNPTNRIWSSSDGISWTSTTPVDGFSTRERAKAVVLGGKIYLIGGNGAGSFGALGAPKHDVWSSTDGVAWTEEVTNAAFDPRTDPSVFVYDGKIWVTGGKAANGTYLSDIWTSTDGMNWTEVTTESEFPGRMGHTTTIVGDKMFVIGGESLNESMEVVQNNDMWLSEDDGVNWRLVTDEDPFAIPGTFIGRSNHSTFMDSEDNIWILGGLGPKNEEGFDTFPRDVWRGKGVQ